MGLILIYLFIWLSKEWYRLISVLNCTNIERSLTLYQQIFDVSAGRKYYGPEGGYHYFAGRDASRSFVSGCMNDNCENSDSLDGLAPEQVEGVNSWLKFYEDHQEYQFVGYVKQNDAREL